MRLLTLTLLLLGCSRHDGGASSLDLSRYQQTRDTLCAHYDASKLTKCDRSTYHVAMSAMCHGIIPLPTQYESPNGKWNRDETYGCYPEESRSETSQDTYLSLVLTQAKAPLIRAYAYAEAHGWETGEPRGNAGYLTPPLVSLLRNQINLIGESDSVIDDAIEEGKKAFSGYRGNLIANYIWAVARQRGGLTTAGISYLKVLHDETPDSPYFSCLYHRFSRLDNNQDRTISLLDKIGTKSFGWGSDTNSWQLHYALTVTCLEGK